MYDQHFLPTHFSTSTPGVEVRWVNSHSLIPAQFQARASLVHSVLDVRVKWVAELLTDH